MAWIRRETERGTVQYVCPHCSDYHEFREDFGERAFNENYIFCRRCGAKNGTGTAPTLTQPNEWVSVEERLPEESDGMVLLTDGISVRTGYRNWMFRMDDYPIVFVPGQKKGGGEMAVTHWMKISAPPNRRPPEGETNG